MSIYTDVKKIQNFFTPKESNKEKDMGYADNPDSIFDDLARHSRLIMFIMLIPSAYIGINYHIGLFEKNGMGVMGANLGSLLLFCAIEIACCFFAPKIFRAIFSGAAFKGLISVIATFIAVCFIVFCYWFKFGISTGAFSSQHANNKKTELSQKNRESFTAVSIYDKQIKNAQKTIDRANKQTWDGKLTKKGEYLLGEGNKTMQDLLSLKSAEMAELNRRDSLLNSDGRAGIEQSQKSANTYGGIIELTMLLCSILTALFAMASEDAYKEKRDKEQGDTSTVEGIIQSSVTNLEQPKRYMGFDTNKNITNIESRTPIGFKHYDKPIEITLVEKKTNVVRNEAEYLEKIINSHQILFNTEEDLEKKNYYEKIINSHKILLNTL